MNRFWIGVVIILLLIIGAQQWHIQGHACPTCPEIKTGTTTTSKIDTIKPEPKTIEKITHKPKPVKTIPWTQKATKKVDSASVKAGSDTTLTQELNPCDNLNIYKDSSITPYVSVYTEDTIRGEKIGGKISIVQKGPLAIKETITTTITNEVKVPTPVWGLYAGVGVSGTFVNGFKIADIKPQLAFITKKGISYGYGYGLFTKTHEATLKKLIFQGK